jgi:hypothetical protein
MVSFQRKIRTLTLIIMTNSLILVIWMLKHIDKIWQLRIKKKRIFRKMSSAKNMM